MPLFQSLKKTLLYTNHILHRRFYQNNSNLFLKMPRRHTFNTSGSTKKPRLFFLLNSKEYKKKRKTHNK